MINFTKNFFRYKKNGIRFIEVWYPDKIKKESSDVVIYNQSSILFPGIKFKSKKTIILDLSISAELLFLNIKPDTRNAIRRSTNKDKVSCSMFDVLNESVRTEFYDFYDNFSLAKGLSKVDRFRLNSAANQGVLAVSCAKDASGRPFIYHAYLCFKGRARLLLSASDLHRVTDSAERNCVGRANRYLHWQDICLFKSKGFDTYDFGGWYTGVDDKDKLRINKFKEEFGGFIVAEYDAILGLTIIGKLAILAWNMKKKLQTRIRNNS